MSTENDDPAKDNKPSPAKQALERFDKPLPTKRKALRGRGMDAGGDDLELPVAKPKERLRPPGEVPDRLKYKEAEEKPTPQQRQEATDEQSE
jgi:hypothetical protein